VAESCEPYDTETHLVFGSRPSDYSALVEVMDGSFIGADSFTAVPVWAV